MKRLFVAYLRVVNCFLEIELCIANHHILACDGIPHPACVLAAGLLVGVFVLVDLASGIVVRQSGINICVALFLFLVELLHELLDVGDAVAAAVVLARNVFLGIHGGGGVSA